MKFGSVCSGIEAASVAWHPLGWQAAWFAEIEPFPCAVLAHHYPAVPNLGDMTTIAKRVMTGEVEAPDVLAGGTPCQAFSVAGLRKSLADERGNLTLKFVELADAIDFVRVRDGRPPAIVFWENVPGVLSTKDNAFGCFLAGLAGENEPLRAPGGKWANAGAVYGPARAIAWRTVDAQYFGLAQRRRRVFVVASARDGFDPATVLFEWDGVRRDSAPSREAREGSAGRAARSVALRGREGGGTAELGDELQNCLRASGGGGDKPHVLIHADPIARCDTAGEAKRQDWETCNFVAHSLRGEGFDASEDGTGRGTPLVPVGFNARQDPDHWHDRTGPLDTDGGTQAVSYAIQAGALRTNPASGPDGVGVQADHAYTLEARAEVQAVAFAENSRAEVRLEGGDGSRCGAISTGGGKPGQGVPMVLQRSLPETLYNKGFNALEEGNASTQETYPGTLLRTLRQEAGEEAFAQWGLGILDSLQQAEVLRQALHGIGIRPATFSRSWVVCCALGFPVHGSGWLLQSLREAGCERCSSQGWEPSEQLAGELGAYLSELSRPGAQAARFMRDLWFASEGFGLLQQALLAIQEVGRPASRKGQSVLRGSEGRGAEIPEDVSSARMQREAPRERVLREACAAGEARDYWNGATEQERSGQGWVGEAPLAVRRLIVEECEFLQGFPRGYSKIPWRNKPASECPDGPRYKALGNSWAVPCVTWIGQRIAASIE